MRRSLSLLVFVLGLSLPGSALAAEEAGKRSPNMRFVKNLPYEARNGDVANFGTDIEFARIGGRRYALAGSYRNGMQIVDITRPEKAQRVGLYDCGVTQGDVQVFRQADKPGRIFATYTSDTYGDGTSTCYKEAAALGFNVLKANGSGKNGTFVVELTDPRNPRTVSFVEIGQGSHNMTVHPSGRYLYNSNADLITSLQPAIEVYDISDLATPRQVAEVALPTRPGLGTESHDISFNSSGTRAFSAALSQGVILDTSNPASPKMVASFLDPAINVWHEAELFTLRGADGAKRDFLIVEDEFAGAAGGPVCPSGGFHVYDITGDKELNPEKVGMWNIDEVRTTTGADQICTAHVFRVMQREQLLTVAYYNGGVRVVDISGLEGIGLGSTSVTGGMKQIGFYRFENADTWSAKTPTIDRRTGDFYLYGNDMARGLDIYKFDGAGTRASEKGRWSSGRSLPALPTTPLTLGAQRKSLICLVP
jgi:hypothetical protein